MDFLSLGLKVHQAAVKSTTAFMFNIKNHSREVRNIQRCKVEFIIILTRVNDFDIDSFSTGKIEKT